VIRAGQRSSELSDDVVLAFEDDASCSVCVSHNAVTDFESGAAKRFGRNRDLILGTDRGGTSPPFLYFYHERKGNAKACGEQRRAISKAGEPLSTRS
jgi:hypothetical protein